MIKISEFQETSIELYAHFPNTSQLNYLLLLLDTVLHNRHKAWMENSDNGLFTLGFPQVFLQSVPTKPSCYFQRFSSILFCSHSSCKTKEFPSLFPRAQTNMNSHIITKHCNVSGVGSVI